ncbi:hypothetical protein HanIR_Chr04g0173491 [Helianthus annuus]|nr:hypothetical protein HanIR_Chr04g0173491 [Helianthus annuus]
MPLSRNLLRVKKPVSPVHAEPSSAVNEDLLPSTPRAPISEQLESSKAAEAKAEKITEAENPEVEKPVEVESEKIVDPMTVDVDVTHPKSPEVVARDPEKGKSVSEDPVISIPSSATTPSPVNVEKNPAVDEGFFAQVDDSSPIRPDETPGDYYYRCYSEKKASEIHTPVWNLKKGDTFSDWRVCLDWLYRSFPPGEIKFQEGRPHEKKYHAYLEEAATYTSTTHRIVHEWRSMHKEWAAFEASKKKVAEDEARAALLRAKLEADRAKFESDQKTEEWCVAGWKRKAEAEAALLSKERKNWRVICEKDNNEKIGLRNIINNLKAEVERLKKQDADIEKLKQEKVEAEAARNEARSRQFFLNFFLMLPLMSCGRLCGGGGLLDLKLRSVCA